MCSGACARADRTGAGSSKVEGVLHPWILKDPVAVFHQAVEQVDVVGRRAVRDQQLGKRKRQRAAVAVVAAPVEQVRQKLDERRERPPVLRRHLLEQIINEIRKVTGDPLVRPLLESIECLHRHDRAHLIRPGHPEEVFKRNKYDFGTQVASCLVVERAFDEPVVQVVDRELVHERPVQQRAPDYRALAPLKGRNVSRKCLLEPHQRVLRTTIGRRRALILAPDRPKHRVMALSAV